MWSEVKSLSCVLLFATLWTVAHQAPSSMGLSRQEYWSGVPLPSPVHLYTHLQIFSEKAMAPHSSTLAWKIPWTKEPGRPQSMGPLSQWCHPTISSSVVPFSFCLQSFSASGSFPMSQLFESSGQSIRASASVLPVNIQGWFPPGLTGLISLQSKGLSSVFSSTTVRRHQFFGTQPFLLSTSHIQTYNFT